MNWDSLSGRPDVPCHGRLHFGGKGGEAGTGGTHRRTGSGEVRNMVSQRAAGERRGRLFVNQPTVVEGGLMPGNYHGVWATHS